MAAKKIGCQTPTESVVLPYSKTLGPKAIKLYNMSKRKAMPWQELLAYDMMAVNEEGLWVHSKFGWSIARRNGKSELIEIRELYGLIVLGEQILHTAHRTTTSHSSWERLVALLNEVGLEEDVDFKTKKQMGLETIEILETGGKISFRTRSSKGGLGEGFDLLVIDEAQEYTDDQSTALKYVISDSKNPQTIYCGTPPTVTSSGTVFMKIRDNALQGETEDVGWAEWSVPHMSDPRDKKIWYKTNPSLGTILTERSIRGELEENDDPVDFNIQRYGVWLRYNQKSAITAEEWNSLKVEGEITIMGRIYAGVKFGKSGENACLSVAIRTTDGRIFTEGIDCRPIRDGNGWLVEYLAALRPSAIWIDGANGQQQLADDLKEAKVKHVVIPTTKQVIAAAAAFEQGIFDGTICHAGQPAMVQAVTNCEKRAIGSNGGFGYRALKEGIEIALLESNMLAYYPCSTEKEKKPQKISV